MMKVYRSSYGEIIIDKIKNTDINIDGYQTAIKKPIEVKVLQMPHEFNVETINGWVYGKKGDYLIIDTSGYPYPLDKDIFEDTYNIIGE